MWNRHGLGCGHDRRNSLPVKLGVCKLAFSHPPGTVRKCAGDSGILNSIPGYWTRDRPSVSHPAECRFLQLGSFPPAIRVSAWEPSAPHPRSRIRSVGCTPEVLGPLFLQRPALRDPNIVPAGVLHHVHHAVRLPDHIVRRTRIVRIGCQSNRCPHIQIQAFFAAKTAGPQTIA